MKLNIYITFGASSWPNMLFLSLLCFAFGAGQLVLQKIAGKSKIQVVQANIINEESKLTQAMDLAQIYSQFRMFKVVFIPSALCLSSLGLRETQKRKDRKFNTV